MRTKQVGNNQLKLRIFLRGTQNSIIPGYNTTFKQFNYRK